MEDLWNVDGMTPPEQAAHLVRIRASIRMAYEVLGANLQAALAAAVSSDLEATAKALGVPPAVAVRMATDPSTPDVALMLRGIKIVRRRPNLPVDAIIAGREAAHIVGETDRHIMRLAELLTKIADMCPMDGEMWEGASMDDRTTFRQAVAYARSLDL